MRPTAVLVAILVAGVTSTGGETGLAIDRGPAAGVYELSPRTRFTEGCFPPCRCPLASTEGMTGTFRLVPLDFDGLFWHHEISAIDWEIPTKPPRRVTGKGHYSIGGEFALVHQLRVDLVVGEDPLRSFDSGLVPGGSDFPGGLEITISRNKMECLDTVFDLVARRRAGGFSRGDCSADGNLNIADPIFALSSLFAGSEMPPCSDACDANDDGDFDISDPIFTLGYLFLGGPEPDAPFPACGEDPTGDALGCDAFPPCGQGRCLEEIEAIARESALAESCSAVVRLDFLSRRLLGWQLVCGELADVTEDAARKQAQADTGYGARGRMLNPPDPQDLYVFYLPPGDFGGVGVVSARTGLSLFGGSIVWLGRGDITYPETWRSVAGLGRDCGRHDGAIPVTAHDLVGGAGLETADVEAALDVVRTTALPHALERSGELLDATVLRYPRSVGAFDPGTAEWIVILHGRTRPTK